MWRRFKVMKSFNKFFLFVLLCVLGIVILEIVSKIRDGVEISGEDYWNYVLFLSAFLAGAIFVNSIDFFVTGMRGDRSRR
jgi:hypothetical protein